MATTRLRLLASASGVSYYPQYVAQDLGYFAAEGLEIEAQAPGHGPWGARALVAGSAEIALGGIWRPLMYHGRIADFRAFAQLCVGCPAFILARKPMQRFQWRDLVGKVVVVPDGSPTPLIAILGILRRADVDPSKVHFVQDFLSEEARELYLAGLGDFYAAYPPLAEVLVDRGAGHVVADLAEAGGELPWSVYFSTDAFLDRDDNAAGRFARAIRRGLEWTLSHEPEERPAVLERHFPKIPADVVATAIRSCCARGVWANTVRVAEPHLAAWQEIIIESHLLTSPVAYDDIVDARTADWVETNM